MKLVKIAKIAGKGIVLAGAFGVSTAAMVLSTAGTAILVNKVTNAAANPRIWKGLVSLGAQYAVAGTTAVVGGTLMVPAMQWFLDELMSE